MTIDALPTAPNRNMTPDAFVAAADAFVAALGTLASQVNTDLNLILNATGLVATSATSLTIGTGGKSLTVQANKSFLTTMSVRIYSTATPSNWMTGTVTSYNATTGALVVNVTGTNGSGTIAAWTVALQASGEWVGNAATAGTSGSFTITGTGFTVNPTATAVWSKVNGFVTLHIPYASISGTSNSATFTLTGLPAEIRPASFRNMPIIMAMDNSAVTTARMAISNDGSITLSEGILSGAWTASGTKALYCTDFVYRL